MKIAVSPSETYLPDGVEPLLADLRMEGVPITQRGVYGRRSIEELPPALWLIASFATGAIGVGFLNAMGADAWNALKRVVRRAATTQHQGRSPAIMIEFEFEDCNIVLWSLTDTPDLSVTLDKALQRLEGLGADGGGDDLWYIKEGDEWLTFEERLVRKARRESPSKPFYAPD